MSAHASNWAFNQVQLNDADWRLLMVLADGYIWPEPCDAHKGYLINRLGLSGLEVRDALRVIENGFYSLVAEGVLVLYPSASKGKYMRFSLPIPKEVV